MKLTKSKLKQIIKEEYSRVLREGDEGPFEKYDVDELDGKLYAILRCDVDDYQGECPSEEIADFGDGTWGIGGETYKDAATLEIELDNIFRIDPEQWRSEQPIPREPGPPAGSMPFSQSPAYSDKEKARIMRRRNK